MQKKLQVIYDYSSIFSSIQPFTEQFKQAILDLHIIENNFIFSLDEEAANGLDHKENPRNLLVYYHFSPQFHLLASMCLTVNS